jgi:DNA-binding SARP family transcriptional activator
VVPVKEHERAAMAQQPSKAAPRWTHRPLHFAILGPFEVICDGRRLNLGPYKQRALLAALLCRSNSVAPIELLLDLLWNERPPRTARKNLQVYISALRKLVGNRIQHLTYGYMLTVEPGECDLLEFDRLASAGRAALRSHEARAAALLLGEAVRLWRDQAMVDLLGNAYLAAQSELLTERYLTVYEDWIELELELGTGRHLDVVEALLNLASRHPFRERLTAAVMRALEHEGRHRAALSYYDSHRQLLARELGLDPSPMLQDLYHAILSGRRSADGAPAWTDAVTFGARRDPCSHKGAQLPRDLHGFVGRDEEIAELLSVLSAEEERKDVVLITGPTGVGKTALAVRVAHLIADKFSDGSVLVSMTDETGRAKGWRAVLAELMSVVGLVPGRPDQDSAALAKWRSWVADHQALIILDDASEEEPVRKLLPGCGPSRTVVISTRRLRGLESVHRLELGPFAVAEARQLLEVIADEQGIPNEHDAIKRIVPRDGTLPAVIRAVAVKLAQSQHRSLARLAMDVGARPGALDELAFGDTLLGLRYRRFYATLSPFQRQAFRALGALAREEFDHEEAIEALAGLTGPAELALEELIDLHVVIVLHEDTMAHRVRYAMPGPACWYAAALYREDAGSGVTLARA